QRWLIIYNALVDPRPAEEIAQHCGVGKFTVQKLISRYNRCGVAAVETKGKGGRKRHYLTVEQERQFLEPFFLQAKTGEVATAADHRPLLIMAQDEGRFGRISRPKSCWAPPGIRSLAPSQVVRESIYVFAAVAPSLGKICSLILPTANTETMNVFLKHVSETF